MTTFDEMVESLPRLAYPHRDKLRGSDGLFLIQTTEGRRVFLRLKDGLMTVSGSEEAAPDCVLTAGEGLLADIMAQRVNPAAALILGKVKVSGNKTLLMKLTGALK